MEVTLSQDVIASSGYLFLATRMKRLAERMQADALKIFERNGFGEITPAHMPILCALAEEDGLSVSEVVLRLGISQPAVTRSLSGMQAEDLVVLSPSPDDQRQKIARLSAKGRALVAIIRPTAWREITEAAADICADLESDVLGCLETLEKRLADKPLMDRKGTVNGLEIVNYADALADDFYRINADWISKMFVMEEADEEVLRDPKRFVIDQGGQILFVRTAEGQIIGTGALQPVGDEGDYEFTKMGVDESYRGLKVGAFLMHALLLRARQMGVKKLHLLTNKDCVAAISLYEKVGFYHSEEVMERFAAKYKRANVAMRYPI
ncbi:MAG: MarR family transcriptional regulator [Ponticaulis sp.]|nr:MarR family transcriptional regulator [Ponticaulis sp.]